MTNNRAILEASDLDRRVESFEQRLSAGGDIPISDYLPAAESPDFDETLLELVRVDLEWSWRRGARKPVEEYLAEFPRLASSPEAIGQMALEEFRVRQRLGERLDAAEYARRFGEMTEDWPSSTRALFAGGDSQNIAIPRTDVARDTLGAAPASDALPVVGERFLDFELVDELGRGAFGRVYLARQAGLASRFVALKVTPAADDESEHLARLQHTHIVPIFSVHRRGRLQAVCMPYFGRTTLADALRRIAQMGDRETLDATLFQPVASPIVSTPDNGRPPAKSLPEHRARRGPRRNRREHFVAAVLRIAHELAWGLAHAHDRGLVHRDLKPANILLADDGRAMILDFGLAQPIQPGTRATELVGGTLPYMAPEHLQALRDGSAIGPAADIYSLGAILYEMLGGRLPFASPENRSIAAVDAWIANRAPHPVSLRALDRRVSPAVESIVFKCLAADPAQRYASAEDLAEDLRRQRHDEPLRFATDRSPTERFCKWRRRHPNALSSTAIATISLLAIALVIALWAARGQRIARLEALEAAHDLRDVTPGLHVALTTPDQTTTELRAVVTNATEQVNRFHVLKAENWRTLAPFALLDDEHVAETEGNIARTLFFAGRALERRSTLISDESERSKLCREAATLIDASQTAMGEHVAPASITLGSDDPPHRLLRGYDLLLASRYEEALPLLEAACGESPQDVTAWFLLGNCQVGLRRLPEAESTFTLCASLSPHSYVAVYHRGLCRLEMKRFADAAADFDRVLSLRSDLYGARVNRAIALAEQKQYLRAEQDLTAALADRDAETRLYFLRARVREQLGNRQAAASDRNEGLRLTPRDELSWVARGFAQLTTSPERALSDFRQALRVNPRSLPALRNVAHVLGERMGKTDEALAALDRVVELAPDDLDARASRGVLAARLGKRQLAIDDARLVQAKSRDARTIYKTACTFALIAANEPADVKSALAALADALRRDAGLHELAEKDKDLDAIRGAPGFAELLNAAAALTGKG